LSKKNLSIDVSVRDTELFRNLLNLVQDVLTDKRITDDVKSSYVDRLERIRNDFRPMYKEE
jgi:hypothetical protein